MPVLIDANSTWRNVSKILINAGGTWRNVQKGFINANGIWRQFFTSSITPGTPSISASSNINTVTWTVTFGSNTDSVLIEYDPSGSYSNVAGISTSGSSYTSISYSLNSSNSPIYWRITPYNAATSTYGTPVYGTTYLTMPAVTLSGTTRTSTGYTVVVTNYNISYNLNVSVNNSSSISYGSPSGSSLPIYVTIPNSSSTTLTAYYSFTNYNNGSSASVTDSKLTFVPPGTPTNPVNTYLSHTTNYNYSASWTAPSTGTTPFDYFIQVWGDNSSHTTGSTGSGGTYYNTFGPFSSTSASYSSPYLWNYFQVFARNYDGSSYYLSSNSTSSGWA